MVSNGESGVYNVSRVGASTFRKIQSGDMAQLAQCLSDVRFVCFFYQYSKFVSSDDSVDTVIEIDY